MENIFKDAKFGDKFITKCGVIGIYWGNQVAYDSPVKSLFPYQVIFDNGMGVYNQYGIFCTVTCDDYNIVSKYKEPIDEKKIIKLATINWTKQNDGFINGFILGYRKAMEG